MGDAAKTIQDFNTAILLSPADRTTFQARAGEYRKEKEWKRAIEDYTAMRELLPERGAYESRANAKRDSADNAGAEEDFSNVSSIDAATLMKHMIPILPGDALTYVLE